MVFLIYNEIIFLNDTCRGASKSGDKGNEGPVVMCRDLKTV